MFEDKDFITHDNTHQSDKSEDRGKSQGTVHQTQTDECTWNHQCESDHTNCGDTVFLEIEEQEEKYDNQRNGKATKNLWQSFISIFDFSSDFTTYPLWQVNFLLHDMSYFFFNGRGIDTLYKLGCNGDTTLATPMHDTAFAPLGGDIRNLSQRNGTIATIFSLGQHSHG